MFKVFLFVVLFAVAIIFFTLFRNGANLTEPPGAVKRLAVFLSISSAATDDNHSLAELRTPTFNVDARTLYTQVLDAAAELGWSVLAHDSDVLDANFEVRSPALLFEDDLYVQVKSMGDQQSSLHMRSASRKGGADFAANSGHIQKLVKHLKAKVNH